MPGPVEIFANKRDPGVLAPGSPKRAADGSGSQPQGHSDDLVRQKMGVETVLTNLFEISNTTPAGTRVVTSDAKSTPARAADILFQSYNRKYLGQYHWRTIPVSLSRRAGALTASQSTPSGRKFTRRKFLQRLGVVTLTFFAAALTAILAACGVASLTPEEIELAVPKIRVLSSGQMLKGTPKEGGLDFDVQAFRNQIVTISINENDIIGRFILLGDSGIETFHYVREDGRMGVRGSAMSVNPATDVTDGMGTGPRVYFKMTIPPDAVTLEVVTESGDRDKIKDWDKKHIWDKNIWVEKP